VKLQILQVPDCPNVALLRQRLDEALADTDLAVTVRVVEDGEDAAALGMTGSPTLLVDGVDPFAEPGRVPSISCRLYRDAEGRVSGAPTLAALRRALRTGDRDSSPAAPTLPTWRARAVPADPAERALHHAVLRAFATAGAAPGRATLEQLAAPFAVPAVELLHRLHERDVIRLGPDGNIRAAYPSCSPVRDQTTATRRLAGTSRSRTWRGAWPAGAWRYFASTRSPTPTRKRSQTSRTSPSPTNTRQPPAPR
jgi:hypothetical protein